jgi:hypothetical protein
MSPKPYLQVKYGSRELPAYTFIRRKLPQYFFASSTQQHITSYGKIFPMINIATKTK